MTIQKIIDDHEFILAEAAVIEALRRSGNPELHPRLENALLIYDDAGQRALSGLYRSYIDVAHMADIPIVVCTPTWRANRERISEARITDDVNGDAVEFLKRMRDTWGPWTANILIGGLIGCKNDCYRPGEGLSESESEAFHRWQITRLGKAGVDFLMGATLPALPEAIGMALAMARTHIPYIISFVINREGKILDGNCLANAISEIDAACGSPPLGYMINCAYPSFLNANRQPQSVLSRLIGYQANASSLDHSRLDGAALLQADDLSQWGSLMIELNRKFGIKILGGCCGTSREHLQFIVQNIKKAQHTL